MMEFAVFGLNAPSGAQCFPTPPRNKRCNSCTVRSQCTFWCSVLSDVVESLLHLHGRIVSMHLLVLSAFRRGPSARSLRSRFVSMHLLVLSAFRRPASPVGHAQT